MHYDSGQLMQRGRDRPTLDLSGMNRRDMFRLLLRLAFRQTEGATAVYREHRAGDPACLGRDEESNNSGDVLGLTCPAERVFGASLRQGLLVRFGAHARGKPNISSNHRGGDDVDPDAVRSYLKGERSTESFDARLGRRVDRGPCDWQAH